MLFRSVQRTEVWSRRNPESNAAPASLTQPQGAAPDAEMMWVGWTEADADADAEGEGENHGRIADTSDIDHKIRHDLPLVLRGQAQAGKDSDLRAAFDDVFTFSTARSGGHALAYFIPGDGMATQPGQRKMNWVWYVGASSNERDALLVTRDGHHRHASLRRGMARDELLHDLPGLARRELHPLFARLVEATAEPFLQTIVDLGVPQTVFDRTVLFGDAAFVVRPHTAGGAAKVAKDAQSIAAVLKRSPSDIDGALAAFEHVQLNIGRQMLAYGIALGRQWARL